MAERRVPAGRPVGETAEIAHAALFPMTSTWTTGTVLEIDGGSMIRQCATC